VRSNLASLCIPRAKSILFVCSILVMTAKSLGMLSVMALDFGQQARGFFATIKSRDCAIYEEDGKCIGNLAGFAFVTGG